MINSLVKNKLILVFLFCTSVAFATPTTPTTDFIENSDGTVTHKLTRLVWMRCAMGQTWDDASASCLGAASIYNYSQAMAFNHKAQSKNQWRLPTIAELHSIIERENDSPRINLSLFPNTPTGSHFWSSTPVAEDNSFIWVVGFSSGDDYWYCKDEGNYVRLVRNESAEKSPPSYADFIIHADGTATQQNTGLMWQRCALGQTWTGSSCVGYAVAYNYEQAMSLRHYFAGYNDWRLPNANELLSIADYGRYPAINPTLFPNTEPEHAFWSSTEIEDSDNALIVNFDYGYEHWSDKHYFYYVRLVR
jgi:hypothetical protein